jgi:hypothetical protein
MAMSPHIGDREKDKFVETSEGDTAVRVKTVVEDSEGDALLVNVDGSINTKSLDSRLLLGEILTELKKLNLHMELMTDHEIQDKEILR